MSTFTRKTLPCCISAAMALASMDGIAESGFSLEEVIVTANRVETSAQDTAVALTAYTGENLVDSGISNVVALQAVDPSVNVSTSNGAAYIAMRGVASTDVTEIGDPSVPIARDGFFTNRSFNIFSSMYDVQRIEVLKGPQGTLFGRNSTGGLINIITNKPGQEFEGRVSLDVGNYSSRNIDAMVNVPVSEKVQLRLSAVDRQHDGYRDIEPIGLEADDENNYSWRTQIAFQPTENFEGSVSYQKDNVDQVGDAPFKGTLAQDIDIDDIDTELYSGYAPVATHLDSERTRWEFIYAGLPWGMEVTYSGGYDKQSWKHDLDGTDSGDLVPAQFKQNETPDTVNHEIRFATDQDKAFTAQFGYFYFKEENTIDSGLQKIAGPYSGRYLIKFDYDVTTESNAFFGQVGYRFNDQFKVTAGARKTKDEKTRNGQGALDLEVASSGHLPPIVIVTPGDGEISQSEPTYHVGLEWTPTNDTLVYAKYDTGYKSGGFNSNGSSASVPYDPENIKSWEIGTKNNLFDNRLQLNASLYRMEYEGYQASQQTEVIAGDSQGVFNVGSATINGLETQAILLVGDYGKFGLDVAYIDATFDSLDAPVVDGAGDIVDISGNELPNAPELAFTLSYEQVFSLGDAGEITARIDGKYSSSFYYDAFNNADTESPSYAVGNLSMKYVTPDAQWEIQGYVRNFTDEDILSKATRNYVGHWNEYQFQPPRTYGVRVNYNF
ncbi:TonB-dependent receptor [Aestuariicella hydrocarbonica]|uniref:TonB-dependent receptor n=1 Tax=Pseudomaricurvus hydrocarbonicus TaxID=1470433 RepID=A0A9E5T230_9GAMM|nr:TonB-dependent receptor [Aestuariicella hydrocarbonica]